MTTTNIVTTEETQNKDLMPNDASADAAIYQEILSAGLIYGHRKSRTNPKFKKYIYLTRNGIEIIDAVKTLECLDLAIDFFQKQLKNNGLILLVATQPAAYEAQELLSRHFNLPYVNEKWIGGLLTNFKVISSRIDQFKKMKIDFEKGVFEKYTKKERVKINKSIERMKKMFQGLEPLTRLPDALFVVDTSLKSHFTAIQEARQLNIPVIAIIDSDDNPELVQYPIPANDHAKTSINWIVNKIVKEVESSGLALSSGQSDKSLNNKEQ
jgi:small subunit ribosomal protein S2